MTAMSSMILASSRAREARSARMTDDKITDVPCSVICNFDWRAKDASRFGTSAGARHAGCISNADGRAALDSHKFFWLSRLTLFSAPWHESSPSSL
jgi:hypothetical protein